MLNKNDLFNLNFLGMRHVSTWLETKRREKGEGRRYKGERRREKGRDRKGRQGKARQGKASLAT